MVRQRIVCTRANAALPQIGQDRAPILALNDEEMNRVILSAAGLEAYPMDVPKPGLVQFRDTAPAIIPAIEMGQFNAEHSGLHLVRPRVSSTRNLGVVAFRPPVLRQVRHMHPGSSLDRS